MQILIKIHLYSRHHPSKTKLPRLIFLGRREPLAFWCRFRQKGGWLDLLLHNRFFWMKVGQRVSALQSTWFHIHKVSTATPTQLYVITSYLFDSQLTLRFIFHRTTAATRSQWFRQVNPSLCGCFVSLCGCRADEFNRETLKSPCSSAEELIKMHIQLQLWLPVIMKLDNCVKAITLMHSFSQSAPGVSRVINQLRLLPPFLG